MSKFVCSICGFIYDEAGGYPDGNIPPGTLWPDVPSSFVCPLCGASKAEFHEREEASSSPAAPVDPGSPVALPEDLSYTSTELSAIFSNLAKGCEKQYDPETAELYNQLSSYYGGKSEYGGKADFESMKTLLQKDLDTSFSIANGIAGKSHDRGSLRALKWAEQVSKMIKSHLGRLESGTPSYIENTNVYVCEICGFLFVGDEKPEICPVCKVPSMKMTQIRRGA